MKQTESEPVAILSEGQAAAYLLSAEFYEYLLDALDDQALAEIAAKRAGQTRIKVKLDDL